MTAHVIRRSCRSRIAALAALGALAACAAPAPRDAGLRLAWERNMLSISGPAIPGGTVKVWYIEAYCRSASTHREWKQTVIPHVTEMVEAAEDGRHLRLRCRVDGGVEVTHEIRASADAVSFEVEAVNRGPDYVDAVWAQPCIRVDGFTGATQETYVPRCFMFVDGALTNLDRIRRSENAIYRGGQVFVPEGIDREDVNPRPISPAAPSNGLIGCISADGRRLLATAWEPYQELFQGVITCLHADFRLGGLKPGETKCARGKIYCLDNDPQLLLARYRRDFATPIR